MPLTYNVPHQDVNAYTLASQWLAALGWPNTPANQRALAAWFMSESSHTGTTLHVAGNNPLNITTSSGNYRLVGTHRIAVYNSPSAGAAAFGSLISTSGHNYPGIKSAFISGNSGSKVINAIVNSGWVTGGTGPSYYHTVGGVRRNLLLDAFNGLPGAPGNITPDLGGGYPPTVGGTPTGDPKLIKALQDLGISTDPNHTLSPSEALALTHKIYPLYRGQYLSFYPGMKISDVLGSSTMGDQLNNSVNAIPDAIGGAVNRLFSSIFGVAALIGGGALILFGLYLITKEATGASGPQNMVSPVPIFIREGA